MILVPLLSLADDDEQKRMAISSMAFHYWCVHGEPPQSVYDLDFMETRENLDSYFGDFGADWFSRVDYETDGDLLKIRLESSGGEKVTVSTKRCDNEREDAEEKEPC